MAFFFSLFSEYNWTTVIYSIDLVIALTIVFLERKNPSASLAWILVLFVFPVVGIFLYVMLSQNISRQKIYRLSDREQKVINDELEYQIKAIDQETMTFSNETSRRWKHMIKLNQVYGLSYLTQNNDIEVFTDGKKMFHHLMQDMRKAEKSINVMYYIVKDDMVGKKFLRILTQKASEGVEVRLLMDAIGCRFITRRKLKEFTAAGGKVAYFFKPKLKYLTLKLNYRNHRKIAVIDGKTGYIGGFNIANEYLGFKKRFGYWRDTHIRIRGGAVLDLNGVFLMDWRFASKENTELRNFAFDEEESSGTAPVQIVSSGPNSVREEIKRAMMKMITFAERSVFLQTPYFIPDPSMLESLKKAA